MDQQNKELRKDLIMWDRRRKLVVVQVVCHVVYWYMQRKYHLKKYVDHPINYLEREKVRIELMTKLKCIKYCRNITRMGPQAFQDLCHILERDGGLKPTKRATVEEQVAKCLYILSHSVKNRNVSFFFRRSGETVSRHFHSFLRALISLEDRFLCQPNGSEVPPEILNNNRFHPYFKDCIGALDGTHVRVKESGKDAPRYRGRKGYPTQNVLAACSFDLKFTYVLPGWEGTASDSRIIKNALTREDKLKIPNAYDKIVKELREIYNLDLDKAKVKNRLKTIKEHFAECYDLFKHISGFAWSPITRMFTAEPEVKPHAEKWKCTPIGNYEKLAEIYGKDRATGVGAETAKEKVRRWANSSNNDHVDRIEVIDELVHQNEANLESFVVDEDDVVLSPKSGTSSKAKKRKLSNDGERDVEILKTALQDIASAIREGNASMEKSQGCFPRGELHKALEEIGIAPHLFTEAYLFLTKKSERMMQFFGCPVEYRKETLESMMYDPENRW
ncbi:hypothetical protein ACSBR2_021590 [Camellia fascicularis]